MGETDRACRRPDVAADVHHSGSVAASLAFGDSETDRVRIREGREPRSRQPPVVGSMLLVLALLGFGCAGHESQPDATVPVVARPPTTCDPNPDVQGFRDPATQNCTAAPRPEQRFAFYAFDQLYAYATASPEDFSEASIDFVGSITLAEVLEYLRAIQSRRGVTLSLRFSSVRAGTFMPLEIHADEALDPSTVLVVLRDTIAFRPYSDEERTEFERALETDRVVDGMVVNAQLRDLLAFWHSHPAAIQLFHFDLPANEE